MNGKIWRLPMSLALAAMMTTMAVAADDPAFCTTPLSGIPQSWRAPVSKTISFFETSNEAGYSDVTPDFDCQGVSVGVSQWNAGKGSLATLVRGIEGRDPAAYKAIMKDHAAEFLQSLKDSKTAKAYAQQFQTYGNRNICGVGREPRWTEEGREFAAELSKLISSKNGKAEQDRLVNRKLDIAWHYANWWVAQNPVRAKSAGKPSFKEVLFFADTLTFNGCFYETANFKRVQGFYAAHEAGKAEAEIYDYLSGKMPLDVSQHQEEEAKKNAELWAKRTSLDDETRDLLVFGYLTAINIKKNADASVFRYNTIGRRGTIALGEGYVNGKLVSVKAP